MCWYFEAVGVESRAFGVGGGVEGVLSEDEGQLSSVSC